MYMASNEANVGISPKTSSEFLQLYLCGYTVEEIQRQNPGFKLGIIVKARIEHGWDAQKAEHVKNLMVQTRETVQKTQLEAIRFTSDAMVVHQKLLGGYFKKFIQTGNEEDLGPHKDSISIKSFKEYVGLMMQLTGQDSTKKVSGEITHRVESGAIDVESVSGSDILSLMDKKNG